MKKEENTNKNENNSNEENNDFLDNKSINEINNTNDDVKSDGLSSLNLEDEVLNLKDKLARSYAEMENQRRRYEKEKDEAFEYGGFAFAKETLNLLDNLERSKTSLENDEKLKNSDALKKLIEHIEIINNDMISIFKKKRN